MSFLNEIGMFGAGAESVSVLLLGTALFAVTILARRLRGGVSGDGNESAELHETNRR